MKEQKLGTVCKLEKDYFNYLIWLFLNLTDDNKMDLLHIKELLPRNNYYDIEPL